GKGVDGWILEHFNREWNLRIGVPDEILADAIDILRDDGVVDEFRLALDLLRELLTEGDFLLERIEIDLSADIAVANSVRIFLLIVVRERCVGDRQQK